MRRQIWLILNMPVNIIILLWIQYIKCSVLECPSSYFIIFYFSSIISNNDENLSTFNINSKLLLTHN